MLLVQQIFDENDQRFGAEKIRIILAEHGFRVGTKKRIKNHAGTRSAQYSFGRQTFLSQATGKSTT